MVGVERRTRQLAVLIACVLVCGIASVGQVKSRYPDEQVAAGSATSSTTTTGTTIAGDGGTATIDTAVGPGTVPGSTAGGGGGAGAGTGGVADPAPTDPATTDPGSVTTPSVTAPPVFDYGLRTQGVTDTSVTIGLSYNVAGCGDGGSLESLIGASAAGDIPKAIDAFTRWANDGGGVGGRTLRIVVADDGGGGCPEKALAAARRLVDDEQVFAVHPGLHEVSDYAASRGVPTFIGRDDPDSLARLGPNGIGLTQDISGAMRAWAAFARYYLRSDQHRPCLLHPEAGVSGNWPLYESILVQHMADHGLAFNDIVVYKEDVATALLQSNAIVQRMRPRCDQVFFLAGNPLALIFLATAADLAGWRPTWTFTSYTALADSDLAGSLINQNQWANAVGLSTRVPPGQHPAEGNCSRIYRRYYPNDGQAGSAAVQLICAAVLPAVEMMRRGEAITGRLDANALLVGADAITNDFAFDAHVPLDWRFPPGGPYKTKAFSHYTVVRWNARAGRYDFPEYPIYWEVMGPDRSGGVDLRPLFTPASG